MTAKEIFKKARAENRTILYELEAKEIFSQHGIPVNEGYLAGSAEEAVAIAAKIDAPVALKICSPQITHKTDAGGVKLNLKGEAEVKKGFEDIIAGAKNYNPEAQILGTVVQAMSKPDREVIVGALQDPVFGPVVMTGLGGVMVEVLKDVSFRLAPLEESDAREMIKELKGYPILTGVRGKKACDIDALVNILLKISEIITEYQDEIAEIDINPCFVSPDGAVAVDARIVLK